MPIRGGACLRVDALGGDELVLGAFQRAASAVDAGAVTARGVALTRRLSGGPAVWAPAGTVHLRLDLASPAALVACDATRIVNRYVRPLLKALTRLGTPAHYFGRDWVSVGHRPAAWVGFAHDEATGESAFEAFVARVEPFAPPSWTVAYPARSEATFGGREPTTLVVALATLVGRVVEAYEAAYGDAVEVRVTTKSDAGGEGQATATGETVAPLRAPAIDPRPPWASLDEDAIGFVGASLDASAPGLGGDFFASAGLVREADEALAGLGPSPREGEAARAVAALVGSGAYVIDGLRDPGVLARVAEKAAARGGGPG